MEPPPNFPRIYERSGDPERLRGGSGPPHKGHKISCFLLVLLFGLVFLSGILILSLRQSSDEESSPIGQEASVLSSEASQSLMEETTFPAPANQVLATTTTEYPGLFLDIKANELRGLSNRRADADVLAQNEKLRQLYGNFRFYNVSSQDFTLTSELLRNHSSDPNSPKVLLRKNKSPLRQVMEALAMNIVSPSELNSELPQILVFSESTQYEQTLQDLRGHLHEFLETVREVPLDVSPGKSVIEYLKIEPELPPTNESSDKVEEETDFVKQLTGLNEAKLIPMSRRRICLEGETSCGVNGTECFSARTRCDGRVDCSDFADEMECSPCRSFIDRGYLGISRKGIFECDGHFDCPDGEDERGCGDKVCGSDEYSCPTDNICLPVSQRCDFKVDCPDGSDEKGCTALWPEPLESGSSQIASPHSSGILHWRFNESWKVLTLADEEMKDFVANRGKDICTEILLHDEGVLPKSHSIAHHFERNGRSDDKESYVLLDCGSMDCGTRPYAYQPKMADVSSFFKQRIVGGEETVPFDWPSVVAIYIDGVLLCGGALINKNWILSAAHCYKGIKEGHSVVEVIVGMSRVDSRSPYTQIRQVKEIIHHGHFNGTYLTHDVAMLYFEEPLSFNAKVNPVCLNEEPSLPSVDEHCVTVGWGSTHEAENNVNNELLQVEVPIKDRCIQGYNNLEHQICGGFDAGGKDACQGDSGGPLYCASSGPDGFNRHYLAGIVSHGIGCARPETDGVYVRITYYRPWIQDVIEIKQNEMDNRRRYSRSANRGGTTAFGRFRSFAKEKRPDLPFVYKLLNRDCPSGVRCDGSRCIPQSYVCDGKLHCMDRQDELNCRTNNQGEKEHVPGYWKDTLSKLVTPTKETLPPTTTPMAETTESLIYKPDEDMQIYLKPKECGTGYFTCEQIHECIPDGLRCDLNKDCMDGTDEMGCSCVDYFKRNDTRRICDGYLDCPDSSDEADCHTCEPHEYYCSLSRQCIPQSSVCDKAVDCNFGEDEKHCITLVPYVQNEGIKVTYSETGERPLKFNHGYVALNYKGSWSPLCLSNESVWTPEMNERVCQYQNSLRGQDYNFVRSEHIKDPDFLNSPLRVEREDGIHLPAFETASPSFSTCETGVVQSSCSETTRCGVHPLYSKVNEYETLDEMDKEGMFPWQVTLYQEGVYVCGASLIHRNWIMTSKECSSKMNPSLRYVVARMGGHRKGRFLSPHEQVRRVIQFTRVPHTGISLGTFGNAVELGDYVNTICIPSSNWFPFKGKCVISGIDHRSGILNRGVKMTVEEICEINETYDYSVCTDVVNKEQNVCMDNWSGTLSCLDSSNRYYVLGVYHSTQGGCESPDENGRRHPFPSKFRSVSTSTARDAIRKIVGIFNTNESIWHGSEDNCATHRCPLGKCLEPSQVCDGIPHCEDMSDESEYHCTTKKLNPDFNDVSSTSRCASINSTHCACSAKEFMCRRSHLCLDQRRFCDGIDDCGDSSDEPLGCGVCLTALQTLKPTSICDGKVDCVKGGSFASDESAEACCGGRNSSSSFRCVTGDIAHGRRAMDLKIGVGCVDQASICDHCKGSSLDDCENGADDSDCLSISARESSYSEDVFGRPHSSPQGYLHYIAYGKRYLYCAGAHFYDVLEKRDSLRSKAASILCRNEGFTMGGQLTFHETVEKHYVYSYDEEDYKSCKLVYIVCRNRLPRNNK